MLWHMLCHVLAWRGMAWHYIALPDQQMPEPTYVMYNIRYMVFYRIAWYDMARYSFALLRFADVEDNLRNVQHALLYRCKGRAEFEAEQTFSTISFPRVCRKCESWVQILFLRLQQQYGWTTGRKEGVTSRQGDRERLLQSTRPSMDVGIDEGVDRRLDRRTDG